MKYIQPIIALIVLGLFLWLATYSYQHRAPNKDALARLIDRSNQELIEHKMAELYGN